MKQFFLVTTLVIAALVLGCGSSVKLNSHSPKSKIIADGDIAEWSNNLNYIEEKNAAIGFYNDDKMLYISFKTTDRSFIRQAMGQGLTIWLDEKGGKSKDFGIRFPVGRISGGFKEEGPPQDRGMPGDDRPERPGVDEMEKRFKEHLTIYELIHPSEEEPRLFNLDELDGIRMEIKMGRDEGFVYELQIPLNSSESTPYALDVGDSKSIGVGFETAKFEFEQMRGGNTVGRGPGGGMNGGFGGRGTNGRQGGPAMAGGSMPSQFKLWTEVQLSSENSTKL